MICLGSIAKPCFKKWGVVTEFKSQYHHHQKKMKVGLEHQAKEWGL
jgi:hypothetical protein